MAKKSNSKYWEDRIASSTWKTYNSLEEKNRDLLDFYTDASKSVKEELYTLAEKYSKDGSLTLSEMHKQNRLTELNKKYEQIALDLGKKTEETARKNMQEGFQEVYKSTAIGMGDIDFSMPNKKLMEKLLNEPWRGDSFSGRLWKNQKRLAAGLNSLLLTGLQQGKTVTEIAVSLHNFVGNTFNDCHRLIRTETMHYLNSATQQRYKDSGVEYVQIWAAQDERTCDSCGKYHEKVYPIDKCPILPFHANCRCTLLPVVRDFFAEDNIVEEALIKDGSMEMKIPERIYEARGMTADLRRKIQTGIETIQEEYDVRVDGVLTTSLGKGNESAFFAAVPYLKNERDIGFALVINTDYDYNNFEKKISRRYKEGYFAGKTLEDYIAHEMAHIMTFQECKTVMHYNNIKRLVNTYYVHGVSKYSDRCKSGTECVAEAFVRMRNGEKIPSELKAVVKYYVERWKK